MPFKEKTLMDVREEMALLALDGRVSLTEVAAQFGVSRPTVRMWLDRYRAEGRVGLEDRSHATQRCPHKTSREIEDRIVAAAKECRAGAKKIRRRLIDAEPNVAWPSQSTFDAIFARRELTTPARKRQKAPTPFAFVRRFPATQPGELFTMDYKGQFRVGTGEYCYPITIMDFVSRFILCSEAQRCMTFETAWGAIDRTLRKYGCPSAMQADNGTPFGVPNGGISSIAVKLMQRDILPAYNRPGKPQDNGRHERMHRELKRKTARPPARTIPGQQRRFAPFIHDYNYELPHEGIGMQRPANVFHGGVRPYPNRIPKPEYQPSWETRKVNSIGQIKWSGHDLFIGAALAGETIACELAADDLVIVRYYRFTIGRFDERTLKFL